MVLQSQLGLLEEDVKESEKVRAEQRSRHAKLKENLAKYAQRLETLAKNQNLNRIDLTKISSQIKQKVEEANLNRVFNLKEMGLSEVDDQNEAHDAHAHLIELQT